VSDRPNTCELGHKVFALFDAPLFRRSETDHTPVMMIRLGDRDVAMPLKSLQREFCIADDTPDGKMLNLIAEALEFVSALRIGDKLPSEVLTGAASWQPGAEHVRIASARLQIQLIDWLGSKSGAAPCEITPETLAGDTVDASVRQTVHEALAQAADELRLPSPDAVLEKIADLAQELAYIEALRDRLLRRVQAMAVKLERLAQTKTSDSSQAETLNRVRQLGSTALKQIRRRFDEQDAQIGEVMAALRHIESHRTFIRANRDWLYRSQRAWDPILQQWDATTPVLNEGMRTLLGRTYHFMAPRFMPATEWVSSLRPTAAPKNNTARGMVW
jgi:hypothetical protein